MVESTRQGNHSFIGIDFTYHLPLRVLLLPGGGELEIVLRCTFLGIVLHCAFLAVLLRHHFLSCFPVAAEARVLYVLVFRLHIVEVLFVGDCFPGVAEEARPAVDARGIVHRLAQDEVAVRGDGGPEDSSIELPVIRHAGDVQAGEGGAFSECVPPDVRCLRQADGLEGAAVAECAVPDARCLRQADGLEGAAVSECAAPDARCLRQADGRKGAAVAECGEPDVRCLRQTDVRKGTAVAECGKPDVRSLRQTDGREGAAVGESILPRLRHLRHTDAAQLAVAVEGTPTAVRVSHRQLRHPCQHQVDVAVGAVVEVVVVIPFAVVRLEYPVQRPAHVSQHQLVAGNLRGGGGVGGVRVVHQFLSSAGDYPHGVILAEQRRVQRLHPVALRGAGGGGDALPAARGAVGVVVAGGEVRNLRLARDAGKGVAHVYGERQQLPGAGGEGGGQGQGVGLLHDGVGGTGGVGGAVGEVRVALGGEVRRHLGGEDDEGGASSQRLARREVSEDHLLQAAVSQVGVVGEEARHVSAGVGGHYPAGVGGAPHPGVGRGFAVGSGGRAFHAEHAHALVAHHPQPHARALQAQRQAQRISGRDGERRFIHPQRQGEGEGEEGASVLHRLVLRIQPCDARQHGALTDGCHAGPELLPRGRCAEACSAGVRQAEVRVQGVASVLLHAGGSALQLLLQCDTEGGAGGRGEGDSGGGSCTGLCIPFGFQAGAQAQGHGLSVVRFRQLFALAAHQEEHYQTDDGQGDDGDEEYLHYSAFRCFYLHVILWLMG